MIRQMLKPSMDELFRTYGAFPIMEARRWVQGSSSVQEYTQEGRLALIEAWNIVDWDRIEHPNMFVAFARRHIRNQLREMSASIEFATSGSSRSLNRVGFHSRSSLDAVFFSTIEGDTDKADEAEDMDAILSAMDYLTARQRRVMGLYYLDGILNDEKVADVLGVSQQAVNKTRLKAEERIRAYILEDS